MSSRVRIGRETGRTATICRDARRRRCGLVRIIQLLVIGSTVAFGCGGRSTQPAIENRASTSSAATPPDADVTGDEVTRIAAEAEARRIETERRMLAIVDLRIAEALDELAAATSEAERDAARAKLQLLRDERARILADRARRASGR